VESVLVLLLLAAVLILVELRVSFCLPLLQESVSLRHQPLFPLFHGLLARSTSFGRVTAALVFERLLHGFSFCAQYFREIHAFVRILRRFEVCSRVVVIKRGDIILRLQRFKLLLLILE